jgi:Ca-activated chloride channel family protein
VHPDVETPHPDDYPAGQFPAAGPADDLAQGTRLGGEYHDGNAKLVPTAMLQRLGTLAVDGTARLPGQRELAILLVTLGATLLAGLPLLLHFAGSRWNPGPRRAAVPKSKELAASFP